MNVQQRFLGDGQAYRGTTYKDMYFDRPALKALSKGRKQKAIFLCSMTDWAAVNEFARIEWAIELLQACAESKHLCYLLTKRTECLPEILRLWQIKYRVSEWPSNVWLGFTAEDQKWFDKRWLNFTDESDGVLGRFPGANVFVSYEPALGGLVLPDSFCKPVYEDQANVNSCISHKAYKHDCLNCYHIAKHGSFSKKIDSKRWLIAGGESGPNARPHDPVWFINIIRQCKEMGVIPHFKQWGWRRPHNESITTFEGGGRVIEWDGLERTNRKKGMDLLFGKAFKYTPLSEVPNE